MDQFLSLLNKSISSDSDANAARFTLVQAGLALYGLYSLTMCASKYLTVDNIINSIPGASGKINDFVKSEVQQTVKGMFTPLVPKDEVVDKIPENGIDLEKLMTLAKDWSAKDAKSDGTYFAYMYESHDTQVNEFIKDVFLLYQNKNALSPIAFPALRKMEIDVCRMTANMLNGPAESCGTITSGGTESILCALKAYRDRARDIWPWIKNPNIIAPASVHVAFPKGCHILDMEIIYVPLLDDGTPDMSIYQSSINNETILLVGSSPQYPHGIIDPIKDICNLSFNNGRQIPVHVDACIGGFVLPFIERLGYDVPVWDFRLDEVTSISADLHKYGYAPKGASTLTFRNNDYRKYQFWSHTTWPGGLFMSPSFLGTRGGGPIAASWASLMAYGVEGYMRMTKRTLEAKDIYLKGIRSIPQLRIIGQPQSTIIAWTTRDDYTSPTGKPLNVLCVADAMELTELKFKDGSSYTISHKWGIERAQYPSAVHMTLMDQHINKAQAFITDLEQCVRYVEENPQMEDSGSAAMYGMVAKIPSTAIVDDFLIELQSQVLTDDAY